MILKPTSVFSVIILTVLFVGTLSFPQHVSADYWDIITEAVRSGDVERLKAVYYDKFEINHQNRQLVSLLHEAAYWDQVEVARFLVEKGANINILDSNGQTPVSFAVRQDNPAMVRYLIENGGDITGANTFGMTNLHWAAASGSIELVQLFLDFGLDIAAQNRQGRTPLHVAAQGGKTAVIRLLLDNGADPAAKDKEGRDALVLARYNYANTTAEEVLQGALGLKVERLSDINLTTPLTSGDPLENFVLVPGGWFEMGDRAGDGAPNESPVHRVWVDDFYIGKFEVTLRQWTYLMGALQDYDTYKRIEGSQGWLPVTGKSYVQITSFIEKLNAITDMNFRLPTEAEWEYAARSAGSSDVWSGTSNKVELVNYAVLSGNSTSGRVRVGSKLPNGIGLYDMTGNALEWTSDWWDEDYYSMSAEKNPTGPDLYDGPYHERRKVVRGGDYKTDGTNARNSARKPFSIFAMNEFDQTPHTVGFRLVHGAPQE